MLRRPPRSTRTDTLCPYTTLVRSGRLALRRFIELTSSGPQRVFGLVGKGRIALGYDADFTVVDLKKRWTVGRDWLASRCDWSPFEGMELTGKAVGTIKIGRAHV